MSRLEDAIAAWQAGQTAAPAAPTVVDDTVARRNDRDARIASAMAKAVAKVQARFAATRATTADSASASQPATATPSWDKAIAKVRARLGSS